MPPHSMKHIRSTIIKSPPTTTTTTTTTTIIVAIIILSTILSLLTVRHFLSPKARQLHVIFTSAGALLIGFTTVLMPTIDVYATATHTIHADFLQTIYIGLFTITGIWLGLMIPFSFFFAKSHTATSLLSRICRTLKSTIIYFMSLVILLLLGLAYRPGHEKWSSEPLTQNWMKSLFDTKHQGISAVLFLTGALATIGCTGFILYTAYGMATLPLDLIHGYKDIELERLEIETEMIKMKSRLRMLDKKGSKTFNRATIARNKLEEAVAIKRQHIRALDQLGEKDTSSSSSFCCRIRLVGPCRKAVGFLFLGITFLLTSALILSASDPGLETASGCTNNNNLNNLNGAAVLKQNITNLGKVVKLMCQAETGYLGTLLNKPRLLNPFDESLVWLSEWFPLDMIVMSSALAYMFAASLYGILRLGLRCCICLAVYRFKRRQTSSSAMLIFGAVVMVMALALLSQVPALAPKYATFGSQTGTNKLHCSLSDEAIDKKECTMSQIAILLVTLVKEFPLYSHIFYLASWLHATVVVLSLLLRICCGGRAANFTDADFSLELLNSEEEEDNDSDVELASKKSLLGGNGGSDRNGRSGRSGRSGSGRSGSITRSLGDTYR